MAATHAARRVDDMAQRDAELELVQTRPVHAAGQAEQPGACGVLRADLGEGGPADPQDLWNAEKRLDIVDRRWLAEQAHLSRERRLVARLGPLALDRVDE